jgi:hypothetical protein
MLSTKNCHVVTVDEVLFLERRGAKNKNKTKNQKEKEQEGMRPLVPKFPGVRARPFKLPVQPLCPGAWKRPSER